MIIKVLGTGCKNCQTLESLTKQAILELGVMADVAKVSEMRDIMAYGVMSTPALVIDEKVLLAGRVPKLDQLKSLIGQYCAGENA